MFLAVIESIHMYEVRLRDETDDYWEIFNDCFARGGNKTGIFILGQNKTRYLEVYIWLNTGQYIYDMFAIININYLVGFDKCFGFL